MVSAQRGFSLLEVLVALVIIGIATALAGLGVGAIATTRHDLDQDARQLAQLFPIAQAEARSRSQPLVWEYDEAGYRFRLLPRALTLPVDHSQNGGLVAHATPHALRARTWRTQGPVRIRITPEHANVFDGEWMPPPMTVELRDDRRAVTLARHGDGRYTVQGAR